jgi:hypothetical protein
MADHEHEPVGVNPGYAAFQIAKAFATVEKHSDPAARERAKARIAKWETVLKNILTGSVAYGSRTPVEGIPGWATLEVVTGGFATGALLAGGQIQVHEKTLLDRLPPVPDGEERCALNAHFLTEAGLKELQGWLRTGCFEVGVPEEGALLAVAWLVQEEYTAEANRLLDELIPYFSKLRFYPVPLEQPRRYGSRVHLQDVGTTISDLQKIRPNKRILAQREAVTIWAPFYDRVVALFLETVEDDWPCRIYPAEWQRRAETLINEYRMLRTAHPLCGKPERTGGHFAQLRGFLEKCATDPKSLTGREVGRIRLILRRFIEKRGTPGSATCAEARRDQAQHVSAPVYHAIAKCVVIPRLSRYAKADGLDDVSSLKQPVTEEETVPCGIPEGTSIPPSIQRKVERCLNETAEELIERGLITSGETLARVFPQVTSELRATGIADPILRQLYASIYRAFRRRRSLLLLNLESQIRIEELPWVAAIERFRNPEPSDRELAEQTLEEITFLTLTSFPYAILPNKLLQEMRALAKHADLDLPLVDELAADIFMGEFARKFVEAAHRAAEILEGTLYATYYSIDYQEIRRLSKPGEITKRTRTASPDQFAQLCSARAGIAIGMWDPAANGMIIEQQQIVTTQNLAALLTVLGLHDALSGKLDEMAKRCFRWICKRQQMKIDDWHARLVTLKNTAYAWRQMIFFLALRPQSEVADFLCWAEAHLNAQKKAFQERFRPALEGLKLAAAGEIIDSASTRNASGRLFLGWSKTRHWMLD